MDIRSYIQQAVQQPFGAELYIPCEHKKQQMKLRTELNNAAELYCKIIDTSIFLLIKRVFKDRRFWVVIQKLKRTQAVFVKETEDSPVSKINGEDPDVQRMIKLMREDGYDDAKISLIVKDYIKENNG